MFNLLDPGLFFFRGKEQGWDSDQENPVKIDILQQVGTAYLVTKPGAARKADRFLDLSLPGGREHTVDGQNPAPLETIGSQCWLVFTRES